VVFQEVAPLAAVPAAKGLPGGAMLQEKYGWTLERPSLSESLRNPEQA